MMTERIQILVCDRGFVLVGRVSVDEERAFHWRVRDCRCVRRWGTTNGLAQLRTGPTENTVLDDMADESVPFRAVLRIINVEEAAWSSVLSSAPVPKTRPRR